MTEPVLFHDHDLHVIDGTNLAYRAHHVAGAMTTQPVLHGGEPGGSHVVLARMMMRIRRERRGVRTILVLDPFGPNWRNDVDPDYKAGGGRAHLVERLVRFSAQFAPHLGWAVARMDGYEADDLIAAIVMEARARLWSTLITTPDKDMFQLVTATDETPPVVVRDPNDKVWSADAIFEKLGVRPNRVRDYLALVGDKSDGVLGVPGCGPKTAIILIEACGGVTQMIESAWTLGRIADGLRGRARTVARELFQEESTTMLLLRIAWQLVRLDDGANVVQFMNWRGDGTGRYPYRKDGCVSPGHIRVLLADIGLGPEADSILGRR